jgi:hypothetical protein
MSRRSLLGENSTTRLKTVIGDDGITQFCSWRSGLSRPVLAHGPRQVSSQLKTTLCVQGVNDAMSSLQ